MFYNIGDYIINKHFDELNGCSGYLRRALIFKYMTEEMPLSIHDGDRIAGWYGFENSEDAKITEKKQLSYDRVLSESQTRLRSHMQNDLKISVAFNGAHTCIDYGTVVEKGISYYISLVEAELQKSPDNECLQAMKMSLDAAMAYAERFASVAYERIKNLTDSEERKRTENIYSALCRVPRYGARTFLEAAQSVWIMHSLVPMAEMSWASISVGRIDKYMYPFYQKHIAEGGEREEARAILKNLFMLLDSYGDGACAMNIGGLDTDDTEIINELSLLLIEVEKEMSLRAPIFAVRVTPDTSDEVLDSVIDFDLFKIGQPTFYGEMPCRSAMLKRGVPASDALGFSANSCMGLFVSGKEFADMWGIKFNSHLPLELAINGGKPLNCDTDVRFSASDTVTDLDGLLRSYGKYFSELIAISAEMYESVALGTEKNYPDPLLSALTDGCIQNRRDRSNGAVYNTVTVETLGLINTCDAISAINELVFCRKKYTVQQLITAVKANYEGYEEVLSDILSCKKYGMGDPDYGYIIKTVGEVIFAACKKVSHGNRYYLPSLHTLNENVNFGNRLYATLDGRRAGEPVNKNAGPSLLLKKREHTSDVVSATSFDQSLFSGGQPLDLYFEKQWFETKELRDKIKALIKTYFELGGLQIQVNSVDIDLLEKAHASPNDYPFVIVRRGGYSVRFSDMSYHSRAEFIELAKKSEKAF